MTDILTALDAGTHPRVAELRARGQFFWLDVSLDDTGPEELAEALVLTPGALRVLRDTGAASPRTLQADEASVAFTLRGYLETGAPAVSRLRPVRVHVVITADCLLTAHSGRRSLPAALAPHLPPGRDRRYVVYSVLDALVGSTSDALAEVELPLDALAADWVDARGGGISRTAAREATARLSAMRRWCVAEEAVFERLSVDLETVRGFEPSAEAYFDRLHQQAHRLVGSIDAAANAAGMLIDLQLNERAYLVSVIATIFVPLTFLTGFFGMNFGWMVGHIDSPLAFWLLALILPGAAALLAWRLVVRRLLVGAPGRTRR